MNPVAWAGTLCALAVIGNLVSIAVALARIRLRDPVPGRTITAHGECHRIAGDIAFVRGYAHDGDPADQLALATGTFMMTESRP